MYIANGRSETRSILIQAVGSVNLEIAIANYWQKLILIPRTRIT